MLDLLSRHTVKYDIDRIENLQVGTVESHILGQGDRRWAGGWEVESAPTMADLGWPN